MPHRLTTSALLLRLRLMLRLREELLHAPLEPVLHPSVARLRWLGLFTVIGHPLFAWIWGDLLPQPYENMQIRLAIGLLGLPLMFRGIAGDPAARGTTVVFGLVAWVQLPFFFFWMYGMNHGNATWLASVAAMIVIYYHLTDWRLATLGTLAGALLAWVALGPDAGPERAVLPTHVVVLGFAWVASLLLGVSSANLRRVRLTHAMTTVGVLAHELRTPLSTASLIAQALQAQGQRATDPLVATQLEQLAGRLHVLTRNMNHQIDTQIANARLLQLPDPVEPVPVGLVVRETLAQYPFRTTRERDCVELIVHDDFVFTGSRALLRQVIENLVKNALRSLAAASCGWKRGDLRIEIGVRGSRGRIAVADRGVGMDAALMARIFDPFFSTDTGTGHGLGLAFCQRVVRSWRGRIQVKSAPALGAVFTIDLPVRERQERTTP